MDALLHSSGQAGQEASEGLIPCLNAREEATQSLVNHGWQRLYSALTPHRASVTLLDPSESLQISLQIPIDEGEGLGGDWDLWIEACNRQLSVPLRLWLEEQGVERMTLCRLSGIGEQSMAQPLDLKAMLQVARWLQDPIETIEALAKAHSSQLVLHLAGLGPNS